MLTLLAVAAVVLTDKTVEIHKTKVVVAAVALVVEKVAMVTIIGKVLVVLLTLSVNMEKIHTQVL